MQVLQKTVALIAVGFLLIFLTGCASIISGGHQEITFTSTPDDALVKIDDKPIGKTPITTQLKRKSGPQVVTLEKSGYQTLTFQLKSTINGWFFGNILVGGLFGSSTDSSTGAIHSYSQDMFNLTLIPVGASTLPLNTEVKTYVIISYKNILEELNTKPGQYLKSLFTLMKVPPEKEADYTQRIKTLADQNKDIVVFADKVAALAE